MQYNLSKIFYVIEIYLANVLISWAKLCHMDIGYGYINEKQS